MSNYTKIGVLREGKVPPDKRVTLSPKHCRELLERYPELDLVVQRSPIRAFTDSEYEAEGIKLVDDLQDRDFVIGVKEVPIEQLLANKTYLFFSHTTKMQPYNKGLLQAIVDKGITLLDHELLEDEQGKRVIAFGRFAGIVGAYNGLRAYCEQELDIKLRPAHQCHDQKEMEAEVQKVDLPKDLRVVLTGTGRVGGGAMELLNEAGVVPVDMEVIRSKTNSGPCYHALDSDDIYRGKSHGEFRRSEFYTDASAYNSILAEELDGAHIYIACHYWNPKGPMLLTNEHLSRLRDLKIIADISCDIKEPISSTTRASTISEPFFGFDPIKGIETPFRTDGTIGVMSVDNLPCELPRDSSLSFGQQFIDHVASSIVEADSKDMVKHATIVKNGTLTADYDYLRDWLSKD